MSDETKYPSDLAERFQVRMPKGLRNRIAVSANANKRSMNAEIVATLDERYPLTQSNELQSLLMAVSYAIQEENNEDLKVAMKDVNEFFKMNPHLLPDAPAMKPKDAE